MRRILCLVAVFAASLTLSAQPERAPINTNSKTATNESPEFQIISPEQIEAYQQGAPLSEIVLKTGETLEEFFDPKSGGPVFEIPWAAITCGGGVSESGEFQFESLCGPSIAGTSEGGGFSLGPIVPLGGGGEGIFSDGFESGNTEAWDGTLPLISNQTPN